MSKSFSPGKNKKRVDKTLSFGYTNIRLGTIAQMVRVPR